MTYVTDFVDLIFVALSVWASVPHVLGKQAVSNAESQLSGTLTTVTLVYVDLVRVALRLF